MPLIETTGAASSRGFGQFARSVAANYIEDVFQTWLYTGNGSTQTINNGVDLSTNGGMVWVKSRSAATNNFLFDTARGVNAEINSNTTDAQATLSNSLTAFNTNGFSLGSATGINVNAATYASWTFREQPKFFDVVTYTGNGNSFREINHNLGSTPGCVIIKRLNSSSNWHVMHRYSNSYFLRLNQTSAEIARNGSSNVLTATTFSVQTGELDAADDTNINTATYVAYLFAHNAGGFGASGTDNVISCGSYTGNGGTITVNLGYEPQWVMIKNASATASWNMLDIMRGWDVASASDQRLAADSAGAESILNAGNPTATGFEITSAGSGVNASGNTYIYIAIRRGPMRTPTTGTSVYSAALQPGSGGPQVQITGFPVDMYLGKSIDGSMAGGFISDRLQGGDAYGIVNTSNAWTSGTGLTNFASNTSLSQSFFGQSNISWVFRRAPGFFDVVCYTGNGSASQLATHNLGVAPELYICKRRDSTSSWEVWSKTTGVDAVYSLALQSTGAGLVNAAYNGYATSTTIEVGGQVASNTNGATYVAYLFASCPGVSKVGRYTGNGSSQTINCGFTGGSRFVLIKRTDSTGNWTVFDSARGIVAGNDPALYLNSTAAEVTTADAVDTDSTGFIVNQESTLNLNVNTATYIFLAVS